MLRENRSQGFLTGVRYCLLTLFRHVSWLLIGDQHSDVAISVSSQANGFSDLGKCLNSRPHNTFNESEEKVCGLSVSKRNLCHESGYKFSFFNNVAY